MSMFEDGRVKAHPIPDIRRRRPIRTKTFQGFRLEEQERQNWCWASVSQGFLNHVRQAHPPWSQREIAAEILGEPECETYPERFDIPWEIDTFWSAHGALDRRLGRPYTRYGIKDQVNGAAVALCQVTWDPRSATDEEEDRHYLLVVGWHLEGDDDLFLHVCDPFIGGPRKRVGYSALCVAYEMDRTGRWTYTGRLI